MSKTNGARPVSPCWYCGSEVLLIARNTLASFGDVRDKGWFKCVVCNATAQKNPIKLGPPIKGVKYYTKTMPLLQQAIPEGRLYTHESVRYMGRERKEILTLKILADWGCDMSLEHRERIKSWRKDVDGKHLSIS